MGIYKSNREYKYSLEKDVLILKTGHGQYKFKIENTELLENVDRIAATLITEMKGIEDKQGSLRDDLSHYAKLLLATLNICERYTTLEKKYEQISHTLETLQKVKSQLEHSHSSVSPQRYGHISEKPYTSGPATSAQTATPSLSRTPEPPPTTDTIAPVRKPGNELLVSTEDKPKSAAHSSAPGAALSDSSRPTANSTSSVAPVKSVMPEKTSSADKSAVMANAVSPKKTLASEIFQSINPSAHQHRGASTNRDISKVAVTPTLPTPPASHSLPASPSAGDDKRKSELQDPIAPTTSLPPSLSQTAAGRSAPVTPAPKTGEPVKTTSPLHPDKPTESVKSTESHQPPRPDTSSMHQKSVTTGDSVVTKPAVSHKSLVPSHTESSTKRILSTGSTALVSPSVPSVTSSSSTPVSDHLGKTESNTSSRTSAARSTLSTKTIVTPSVSAAPSATPVAPNHLHSTLKTESSVLSKTPPTPQPSAEQKRPLITEKTVSSNSYGTITPTQHSDSAIRSTANVPLVDAEPASPPLASTTSTTDFPESSTSYTINTPEHYNHEYPPADQVVATTGEYRLPQLSFLSNTSCENEVDHQRIRSDAELLEKKLGYFGIKGEVMGISPGPVITTYEYKPDPGIKISKIVNLADDLALALSAYSIRIVAPIPGKDVMGIEIPNIKKSLVPFIDIVTSTAFSESTSKVPICLGKDIIGNPVVVELESMPHLLIAGATGTGKSVGLNAMITSILYKASPDEVRFLMIDPKRIELSFYNDIPHLLAPVITDMKKANIALQWMVREMDRRYNLLAHFQVRHIEQFNQKLAAADTIQYDENGEELEHLPYIVVIIDELADLMMTASRDIEFSLTRLAQMARAAGIHLILATQRPSVDVLTGIIKANFPTRISFQVSSKTDSRTIIDSNGAETLLGNGDMLFVPPGTARLTRVHGTYLSEDELLDITSFIKKQRKPDYVFDVVTEQGPDEIETNVSEDEHDEKYNEAMDYVMATRQASISGVQRALRVGYNRAARIIDLMEKKGVVGPSDGVKPRKVLVNSMHMER